MTAHYRNGPDEAAIHADMLYAPYERRLRIDYYETFLLWIALLGLGAWCAFQAGNDFALIVFATYGAWYAWTNFSFAKSDRETKQTIVDRSIKREISITADHDGLHEFIEGGQSGIQSSVPWELVLSFRLFQDVLFIQLHSDLHAIVPKESFLSGEGTFEDFIAILRERNIEETPAPDDSPLKGLF